MDTRRHATILTSICCILSVASLVSIILLTAHIDREQTDLDSTRNFQSTIELANTLIAVTVPQGKNTVSLGARMHGLSRRIGQVDVRWVVDAGEIDGFLTQFAAAVEQGNSHRLDEILPLWAAKTQKIQQTLLQYADKRLREIDQARQSRSVLSTTAIIAAILTGLAGLFFARLSRLSLPQCSNVREPNDQLDVTAIRGTVQRSLTPPALAQYADEIENLRQNSEDHRRRVRLILDNAVDVICLLDQNTRFVEVNPACLAAWGYTPQELIGTNLSDLVLFENLELSLLGTLSVEKSIDRLEFENRMRTKDGKIIHLLWSARWSLSDNGLFCVAHDITARKTAEELLRESEQRIRSIIESLPLCVVLIDEGGEIELINPAGVIACGYLPEQLVNRHLEILVPSCKGYSDTPLSTLLDNLRRQSVEVRRNDASTFPAEIALAPLTIGGQQKLLIVLADVSEQQHVDRLKREFVAMISHDLKTPLTSLGVIFEMALSGMFGEISKSGQSLFEQGLSETDRLIKLTRELIEIETLEFGQFSISIKTCSIREILLSATDAMSKLAAISHLSIELAAIEDVSVEADRERIMQVLVNFLSNAIKFSPPGGKILVGYTRYDETRVKIFVRDFGRGIPAEKLPLIFEKFKQVEVSDSTEKGGAGLGLAICKAIVERHNGQIAVDSEEGKGSTFWFLLDSKKGNSSEGIERSATSSSSF